MRRSPDSCHLGASKAKRKGAKGIQGAAPLSQQTLKRLPGPKCHCGKCPICKRRAWNSKWRKLHPKPGSMTGIGTGNHPNTRAALAKHGKHPPSFSAWKNLRSNAVERAVIASRVANHYPGRFEEWSARRLAELRCKWRAICEIKSKH